MLYKRLQRPILWTFTLDDVQKVLSLEFEFRSFHVLFFLDFEVRMLSIFVFRTLTLVSFQFKFFLGI